MSSHLNAWAPWEDDTRGYEAERRAWSKPALVLSAIVLTLSVVALFNSFTHPLGDPRVLQYPNGLQWAASWLSAAVELLALPISILAGIWATIALTRGEPRTRSSVALGLSVVGAVFGFWLIGMGLFEAVTLLGAL